MNKDFFLILNIKDHNHTSEPAKTPEAETNTDATVEHYIPKPRPTPYHYPKSDKKKIEPEESSE